MSFQVFPTGSQRPNAAKAVVIVSAQKPLDSIANAYKAANELRAKGVKVFVVEVLAPIMSSDFALREKTLRELANKTNVIAAVYSKLVDHARQLSNVLCQSKNTFFVC